MKALKMHLFGLIFLVVATYTNPCMAQQTQQHKLKFLALGDSYTIGESVAENERWPVQLVHQLRKYDLDFALPEIIATTGWRTDDLKSAIKDSDLKPTYDLVSLLIGVNNQYQGISAVSYESEFDELLKTAIRLAGGRKEKVIVVSIPDYGFTPFGKESRERISKELQAFNNINRQVAIRHGIAWFDITPISKKGLEQPDLVAEDGLHPSGKMYSEWVDLIVPHFVQQNKDK
jgi:lysophospholipase L1-like esterase